MSGKATSDVRGKGSKRGEPCSKVRLSQDRLPILCTNVIRANVALSKCHSTIIFVDTKSVGLAKISNFVFDEFTAAKIEFIKLFL